MNTPYVPYSDEVEHIQPNEEALVAETVASMGRVNQRVYAKHRHGLRDAHAKSHGIVKGELHVQSDLPDYLRQGLFAQARSYPVIIRFSSAPGDLLSDRIPTHRGMAIKVIGVEGPRALPDDASTQDFLLVNSPTIPFGNIQAYYKFQQFQEKQSTQPDPSEAKARLQARGGRLVAKALEATHRKLPPLVELLAANNNHILGETFHSMGVLRYGDYIAKLSAAPLSASVRALTNRPLPADAGPSILQELVIDFFRTQSATYELRAQLCTDLRTMPVEDASVRWPETESPHQAIATICIPAQDAYSNERRVYADDVLSFTPWHALAAHRPLGSIMRVRVKAYEGSSIYRHSMNTTPRREPCTIDELPD
jgi:hypothetical protein